MQQLEEPERAFGGEGEGRSRSPLSQQGLCSSSNPPVLPHSLHRDGESFWIPSQDSASSPVAPACSAREEVIPGWETSPARLALENLKSPRLGASG